VDPQGWLPFLTELADLSDEIALRHFRSQDLRVEEKPDLTPVSAADLAIEATVRRHCAEVHPDLGVYGEEEGETGEARASRLIVDPIDATRNFVRGIPIFATLLGIEVDGEIAAGIVSAPALGGRWVAARGFGAYSGDRRIRVSGIKSLSDAQLFHGSLAGSEGKQIPPGLLGLIQATARQRGFGDFYQHVLVAEGAGEIALDPIMFPWDIAPLQVIIEEAGGRSTTVNGERSIYGSSLVTTNGLLHDQALSILRGETSSD
jgi:histidinol-phosphatase